MKRGVEEGELFELIGEASVVALAEAFGGTRLYVPTNMSSFHHIAKAIGIEAARKLTERYAPDYIRVPLMRESRARFYWEQGHSAARIAVRLGITESGVDKLLQRLREKGADLVKTLKEVNEFEVIETIGEAHAVALAEEFGGTRLFVPATISPGHVIAQAIGQEAAQELAERYGPGVIRMPQMRAHRAKRLCSQGLGAAQIAGIFGIQVDSVEKLLRSIKREEAKARKGA